MDIKDLFKGVLDDDAIAKIEASGTLKTRLTRGEELASLLDPNEPLTPPAATGALTLADLTNTLKSSLTDFETRLTPKMDERIKAFTDPLVTQFKEELTNARKDAANAGYVARELVRIENEHEKTFSEKFDESKLNDWVKEQQTAGRQFGNVREAYNEWTRDKALEIKLANAREEGKRDAMSGKVVPGVSPAPATGVREKLRTFHTGNNSGKTRTEVLDEKLAALDRKSAVA